MKIVCPACAAAYEVPDRQLLPGRVVRCARCDTDWTPIVITDPDPELAEPEAAIDEAEPPPEREIEPIEPAEHPAPAEYAVTPEPPAPPRPNRALQAAWAASIVAVVFFLGMAVASRDSIMRMWPPSTRAYAAIGLASHQ